LSFDWVKYWDPHAQMPREQLGKWLGVCKNVGAAMTYWILKDNGQVVCKINSEEVEQG